MNQQKALWLLLWENGVRLRREALEAELDLLLQRRNAELAKADPEFQKFMAKVMA